MAITAATAAISKVSVGMPACGWSAAVGEAVEVGFAVVVGVDVVGGGLD